MASETAEKLPNENAPWPPVIVWAVRLAIIAVALYNLYDFLDWLGSFRGLPDIAKTTFYALQEFTFAYIINPLASLVAIVLAAMGRRLKLAAFLAAVPHIYSWLMVIITIIAYMIAYSR